MTGGDEMASEQDGGEAEEDDLDEELQDLMQDDEQQQREQAAELEKIEAATRIQAGVKGYQTRKQINNKVIVFVFVFIIISSFFTLLLISRIHEMSSHI